MLGGKHDVGGLSREVVMSEARRRKRAVFWRARRGVLSLMVGMNVCSQAGVEGMFLEARKVEMEVVTPSVVPAIAGVAVGCRWLLMFLLIGHKALPPTVVARMKLGRREDALSSCISASLGSTTIK